MHVAIGLRASLSAFHFGSCNFVRMRLWSPLFCHGCLLKPFYRRFLTMRSKNLRRRYNRNDSSYEANELAMHWTFGSYHALHCVAPTEAWKMMTISFLPGACMRELTEMTKLGQNLVTLSNGVFQFCNSTSSHLPLPPIQTVPSFFEIASRSKIEVLRFIFLMDLNPEQELP